jgi:hypothetical protein
MRLITRFQNFIKFVLVKQTQFGSVFFFFFMNTGFAISIIGN